MADTSYIGSYIKRQYCYRQDRLTKKGLVGEFADGETFIAGDFNIGFRKTNSKSFKKIKALCRDFGWSPLIDKVTRLNPTGGTTIDNILTDSPHVQSAGVHPQLVSDHLPVFCIRKKAKEQYTVKKVWGWTYKKYSKSDLEEVLITLDWEAFYNLETPEEMWVFILEKIEWYLNETCPLGEFTFRDHGKAWFNNEILDLIHQYREEVIKFQNTGDPVHFQNAKQLRDRITVEVSLAKPQLVTDKLEENRKDPNKFWKTINGLFNSYTPPGCLVYCSHCRFILIFRFCHPERRFCSCCPEVL